MRSATCVGYALTVERLFTLRNIPSLVDLSDDSNYTRIITKILEKEEVIASQRKPVDEKMHAELIKLGSQAGQNSPEALVADIATSGKVTG